MSVVTVGMADMNVTSGDDGVLVTYALGSCIAVLVHDPVRHVAGMIHYMLPQAIVSPDKARETPAMFADTGIPLLFQSMYARGCLKKDLVVKLCGGAKVYEDACAFEIGKRNHLVARKMFWTVGVPVAAEDVGGCISRTARLFSGDGRVLVRTMHGEKEL